MLAGAWKKDWSFATAHRMRQQLRVPEELDGSKDKEACDHSGLLHHLNEALESEATRPMGFCGDVKMMLPKLLGGESD